MKVLLNRSVGRMDLVKFGLLGEVAGTDETAKSLASYAAGNTVDLDDKALEYFTKTGVAETVSGKVRGVAEKPAITAPEK